MTTRYWQGQADAVAQVSQVTVATYDAATTYELLVGGEVVASVTGSSASDVATKLAAAWTANVSPYCTTVTCTASTATLTMTANVAGVPFVFTTQVSGGTGTFSAVTTPTANAGPNDWGTAGNWSGDTVPVSTDDVVFRDGSVPVWWGLDQSAVTLAKLAIEQSYSGQIGLHNRVFVTDGAGAVSDAKPEYRDTYLQIGWDDCEIGAVFGAGIPAGADRLKLDNKKSGASNTTVYNLASGSADGDLPVLRLLANHASADLFVQSAPGGLGIAVDDPAETATVGDIEISDPTPASRVLIGEGTTLSNLTQQGGVNTVRAAANITKARILGGDLTLDGEGYAVTTVEVEGGVVRPNHVPSSGAAITTLQIGRGTVDGSGSRRARTWSTVNMNDPGAVLIADSDVVTLTTLSEPSGPYRFSVT